MYKKLNEELKNAMRNKDEDTKSFIRSIKSKITEYEVANNLDRGESPSNEVVTIVIISYKKSLEKAVSQFKTGDLNNPLIASYEKEIRFLDKYLPDKSEVENDVKKIVEDSLSNLGVSDIKQMGRVIGYIMKNNNGLDGSLVKKLVSEKLRRK